jgi:hypothetical protein
LSRVLLIACRISVNIYHSTHDIALQHNFNTLMMVC